ncbi:BTB/POZ domain-containing protein At2g24240-like [Impatiens glandulifera]|uniref:BTB/POZ domain-containing protein At2g24240-like n=1 Tax=Impatiens glandulifera TaxID=253017 RepID=UPI001FB0FD5F|nr:BTB/POZ domain-containing protein At2g24240-like [Impatiens glandulifera]
MGVQKDRIRFNVGGRIFETTATTLAIAGANSYFAAYFDDNWDLQSQNSGEHFIDRNPDCFAAFLDLLRTGELNIPSNVSERLLYREALFYGLLDHVRTAKWDQFDGNRLRHSGSIIGRAAGDGTAIRGGPDGGCCVAHGSMVHVYDWTMEENPSINLDYQRINDIGWIDSQTIAVAACERLGRSGDGGMGIFSAKTGELRHKFQVRHGEDVKSYTAGAMSFNSDDKIFCSCKGRSNEYGIGVWDQITGKQIDFYYEPMGWSLGEADRLQWLNGTNCLLSATLYPRKDNCYISLLDFRDKNSMALCWSDAGAPVTDERRVRDAIGMCETGSICVVNEYEELGFMDLRNPGANVRWCSRSRLITKGKMSDEPCVPKLALHQGQLFSSMNDSISVFSGPDWVLTSRARRGFGGSICDFSIGGDRLFALHSDENVFDVWETPRAPLL